jgi:competence protein ComEA
MAIAAGLAAVATAAWVLLGAPSGGATRIDARTQIDAVAATAGGAALSAPASGAFASPAPPASSAQAVVVDVAGRVATPGVYTLATGARVADALAAAGGALPGVDLSVLNLARLLVDGEQIPVEIVGDPNGSGGSGASPGAAAGAPIDLNRATGQMLEQLPGVGPVLAQNILDWRSGHGRFDSVDQLREVSGIGEAKYAQLKGRVRV